MMHVKPCQLYSDIVSVLESAELDDTGRSTGKLVGHLILFRVDSGVGKENREFIDKEAHLGLCMRVWKACTGWSSVCIWPDGEERATRALRESTYTS